MGRGVQECQADPALQALQSVQEGTPCNRPWVPVRQEPLAHPENQAGREVLGRLWVRAGNRSQAFWRRDRNQETWPWTKNTTIGRERRRLSRRVRVDGSAGATSMSVRRGDRTRCAHRRLGSSLMPVDPSRAVLRERVPI